MTAEQKIIDAKEFIRRIPHARALNLSMEEIDNGTVVMCMPYDTQLIGDPETGVLHGGAVSTLIDTCCGAAVMSHPETPATTATLDLRIAYMRGAKPGQTITARATCYHVTRTIAFVRATADDGTSDGPVATASGTFTVGA